MRYVLAAGCALLTTSIAIATQTTSVQDSAKKIEREVVAVDREFDAALGQNDAAALDKLVADDCVFTNDQGKVFGKQYRVGVTTSHRVVFDSYAADDVRVQVYGDTAVVTERNTTTSQARDQSHTGQFRYTRVYVKRNGRWQLVAAQKTKIVE